MSLVVVGAFVAGTVMIRQAQESASMIKLKEQRERDEANNAKLAKEKAAFEQMKPSEHLAAARASLTQGTLAALDGGLTHLAAIDRKNPGHEEAEQIKARINARKRTKERQLAAEQAADVRRQALAARDAMAELMEKNMLHNGYSVDVIATGQDHTVLRIKWVLVSKAMAYQLSEQGGVFSNARDIGFKRIEITDGYHETWFWNL